MINYNLKRKYDTIKIENNCLLSILKKLNIKISKLKNNNMTMNINKNNINKILIFKSKNNFNKYKNLNCKKTSYISRLKNFFNIYTIKYSFSNISPSSTVNNKKKINKNLREEKIRNNFFISQKNIIKNRNKSTEFDNKEKSYYNNNKIIKYLNKQILNLQKEFDKKYIIYSKEMEIRNKVKNLINLFIDDLNVGYKKENDTTKNVKEKNNKENELSKLKDRNLEKKLFIFSFIYHNCLNNMKIKN